MEIESLMIVDSSHNEDNAIFDKKWDIVVVGAGPAGSSAATEAAQAGAKVLIVEARRRIGEPLACGGFIPKMAYQEISIPPQVVEQKVTHLVSHLPDQSYHEIVSPGYMVDRPALDRHLAVEAVKAGAVLRCQSTLR